MTKYRFDCQFNLEIDVKASSVEEAGQKVRAKLQGAFLSIGIDGNGTARRLVKFDTITMDGELV